MHLGPGHNYILLPPPSSSLLTSLLGSSKGVTKLQWLAVPCPPHLCRWGRTTSHLTEESDRWKGDRGLSESRCPCPAPTCQSWGEIQKPSSFQPSGKSSCGPFFLKTGPDISITVSQECKKKKKKIRRTLWPETERATWDSGTQEWTLADRRFCQQEREHCLCEEAGLWRWGCGWRQAQGHLPWWGRQGIQGAQCWW